jgi:excisionase family DNA binding protein
MSELYDVSDAARRLKVSVSFLNKLRSQNGGGPRFLRLGRAVRYREEDLDAWAGSKAATSTSEYNS